MILRGLVCFIIILIGEQTLIGQDKDTVSSKYNYRNSGYSAQDEVSLKRKYHYIGFQANQLLRQLIGSAGSADNPFLFAYSFNSTNTGNGMNFGLGFNSQKIDDSDKSIGLNRLTKTSSTAIRVGYDFKKGIGKRWITGLGIDLLRTGSKSETETTFSGGTPTKFNSKSNGFGGGVRFLLMFNVHEKIYLGTEATVYLISDKTTSKGDPNFSSTLETETKETTFKLGVPTALFLQIRF